LRHASRAGELSASDREALRYLSLANTLSRTPEALQSYVESPRATVARTLRRLVQWGLVVRQVTNGSTTLNLTPAGRQALFEDPLYLIAGDNPGEALASGITALVDRMHSRSGRSFGVCRSCHHFWPSNDGQAHCQLLHQRIAPDETGQICFAHQTEAAGQISEASRRQLRQW
jgi:DNA-binding MarR family transcriptional regulator